MKNSYPLSNIPYSINRVIYYNNYSFLYCDEGNFIIKKNNKHEDLIIVYFNSVNFNNYLKDYIELGNYKLFNVSKNIITRDININDIINVMAILHKKSFISNDRIVDSYYSANYILSNKLLNYYLNIQDKIDEMEVILPEYYLLLINISKIYKLINIGRDYLNKWYDSCDGKIKTSYNICNYSFDNYIYIDDSLFIINFNQFKRDFYLVDMALLYKRNYDNYDMVDCINNYKKTINYSDSDLFLFYYLISNPFKIKFSNNHQNNILLVKELIRYVDFTLDFILKKDKEYEKTDE